MEECPKCSSELKKVSSCCSVIYFCEKCNQVVENAIVRIKEKNIQNRKKPKQIS